jgi:NAD(P)-dependent dehydrogenase (short-subunit alcohol dehydrogenase family)
MNRIDLTNRVAVVTGGASGIGWAIVERFVASGARVVIWDRDETAAQAAGAGHAGIIERFAADVRDFAAVEAAARRTIERAGQVDILVNNAGITGPNFTVWDYPVEAWREVLDINTNGVFYGCKVLVPHMRARNYGRIVNIASIAGKEGNPNASAYSASKAAVIALTKSLGKELASSDIRVNCVTPAAVRTPLFEQMTPAHIAFMLSKIPVGRFGETAEIAGLVAWLASEECSFSTGAVFDLSGGRATY